MWSKSSWNKINFWKNFNVLKQVLKNFEKKCLQVLELNICVDFIN